MENVQLRLSNPSKKSLLPLWYAILGGFFASVGAFIEEGARNSLFIFVLIGPLIEEILKPMGVIILLESKPSYIYSKLQILWLCIVGALIFSFLENLIYIWWYASSCLSLRLIVFRYTVCIVVHLFSTSILSLGLMREFIRVKEKGARFELENTLPFIVGAVIFHGGYNLLVYIFTTNKILTF
jgi:hypothetical protein